MSLRPSLGARVAIARHGASVVKIWQRSAPTGAYSNTRFEVFQPQACPHTWTTNHSRPETRKLFVACCIPALACSSRRLRATSHPALDSDVSYSIVPVIET